MHDLRRSYASILISAGVSPAYVQQQLGHDSIKMTVDTYSHLIPGAGRQALAAHLESIPQHLLVLQQRAIEPGRVATK
jgi:integrase